MNEHEIISRLKFIGKLQQGERINTRHLSVQGATLATAITRSLIYHDNRINTLDFLRETITRAFELLQRFHNETTPEANLRYGLLAKDLQRASEGLINLKMTYETDTKFGCDMDTFLEDIHARLSTFSIDFHLKESDVLEKDEHSNTEEAGT
jgi:hypothetical protein